MFQDKLDIDLREPILHIPLPSSWSSAWLKRISFVSVAAKKDMDVDVEVAAIGLILPRFEFWKQLGVVRVMFTFFNIVYCCCSYYTFFFQTLLFLNKDPHHTLL